MSILLHGHHANDERCPLSFGMNTAERVNEIETHKPEAERPLRLLLLREVDPDELPVEWCEAYAKWREAYAKCQEAGPSGRKAAPSGRKLGPSGRKPMPSGGKPTPPQTGTPGTASTAAESRRASASGPSRIRASSERRGQQDENIKGRS